MPLVLALLLAIVIDPAVARLERRGFSRGISVFAVLSGMSFVMFFGLVFVLMNLSSEALAFMGRLPTYGHVLDEWFQRAINDGHRLFGVVPTPLTQWHEMAAQRLMEVASKAAEYVITVTLSLPGLLASLVITGMATFFLSRDRRQIVGVIMSVVPDRWHRELLGLQREVGSRLIGLLKAQLLLAAITGLYTTVCLMLLRLAYPWGVGVLAALLDLIPFVGPSFIFVPLTVAFAVSGEGWRAVGVLCGWVLLLILRQTLEPVLIRKHVGLHPLTGMLAAYFGMKWLGPWGIVVGPFAAVSFKAVVTTSIVPRL